MNTTDSRVELSFDVRGSAVLPDVLRDRMLSRLSHRLVDGVLTVAASEYRSQHRNREAARTRLAELLIEAGAPPAPRRRPTRPTRGSKERDQGAAPASLRLSCQALTSPERRAA